jgi:hypothetical protein
VAHGDRVAADEGQGEVLGQAVHGQLLALTAEVRALKTEGSYFELLQQVAYVTHYIEVVLAGVLRDFTAGHGGDQGANPRHTHCHGVPMSCFGHRKQVESRYMNFIKIDNSWFNLSHVESIEVSMMQTEDLKELYTVVISLGSGRMWSRRGIEKYVLDEYVSQIESAVKRKG